MPGGRPSDYSEETVAHIIAETAAGISLKDICGEAGMPDTTTVWRWLAHADRDEFRRAFRHAREQGAHRMIAEAVDIADEPEIGEITTTGPEGTTVRTEDMLQHRKLRIETRLRVAGIWNRSLAQNTKMELTGPGGGPIKTITTEMTAKEAAEAYADTLREDEG